MEQRLQWSILGTGRIAHLLAPGLAASRTCALEAVRAHGVFLMEAYLSRCRPQTAALIDLIRSGAIGDVRLIQATFGFNASHPTGRLFTQGLGGGGILDVGCYPVSLARLIAGVA